VNFQGELVFGRERLGAGRGIIGDRLVFVNAQKAGVSAHEALIEDAAGKRVKVFLFQGLQMAARDLGGFRDFGQGNTPHLPFAPQPFAKCAYGQAYRPC